MQVTGVGLLKKERVKKKGEKMGAKKTPIFKKRARS